MCLHPPSPISVFLSVCLSVKDGEILMGPTVYDRHDMIIKSNHKEILLYKGGKSSSSVIS